MRTKKTTIPTTVTAVLAMNMVIGSPVSFVEYPPVVENLLKKNAAAGTS